jgi:hypothetical protein
VAKLFLALEQDMPSNAPVIDTGGMASGRSEHADIEVKRTAVINILFKMSVHSFDDF